MGIESGMKDTVQSIASSRGGRRNSVAQIKGGTRAMVKGFQTSRKKGGAQLRKELTQGAARRRANVGAARAEAGQSIGSFRRQRREGGSKLREELSQGRASRESMVGDLRKAAQDLLGDIGNKRREAGNKLRVELSQGRASRESTVGDLRKAAQDLLGDIGNKLGDMGNKLRNDLAKARADRETSVQEMMGEFHEFRSAVRSEMNEARAAWQGLYRRVEKAPARATQAAVTAEPRVAEEEGADLETRLLAAVGAHPQGMTLDEVAESLGVARIVLGRVSKRLLDAGKIRKEDKLYFPVTIE